MAYTHRSHADPEVYRDRDLHELALFDAAMALSEPQRWLLSQKSFRVASGKDPRDRATSGLAAEWRAAAAELEALGYVERSRSGRYWPTEQGRAVIGAVS